MHNLIAILILLIFSIGCAAKPIWIKEKNDPELWKTTRQILKDELQPDDPSKMGEHEMACKYKYISRIMQADNFALVLIGEAADESYDPVIDYFKAYSIDLMKNRKSAVAVGENGFYLWKFEKFANFDGSKGLDAVFLYDSCVECESSTFLGSFQFDSHAKQWKIRRWTDEKNGILIDEYWHGDDDDYFTKCLYAIEDLTHDGRDDIVTYCRTMGRCKEKKPATATLYTITSTGPIKRILKNEEEAAAKQKLWESIGDVLNN